MRSLRVVFAILVHLAFGYLALHSESASAQAQQCANLAAGCDEGKAYQACQSELVSYIASRTGIQHRNQRCEKTFPTSTGSITSKFEYLSGTSWVSGQYRTYSFKGDCSSRAMNHSTSIWSQLNGREGAVGCVDGCFAVHHKNADGTPSNYFNGSSKCDYEPNCSAFPGHTLNRVTNTCDPPEPTCPEGKSPNSLGQCAPEPCPDGKIQQADGTCKNKDNECPAGQIKSPDGKCLPGDGQCASGEVRGKDGTCKKDKDGDGKPDEGEEGGEDSEGKKKDEFAGGDDCKSPPSCSGSPIMCGQARIQWRIDCNTRKNRNIAGGACTTPPICTGEKCDAVEYSGLLMQWRSACALEKLASGNGSGSNPDVAAIRDALTGTGGNPNYGAESPGSGAWQNGGNTPPGKPNTAGYGWSGSCPQPPSFDVMGQSYQFNITPLCNWLSLGSYFVLGLAALFSLKIVASKDA